MDDPYVLPSTSDGSIYTKFLQATTALRFSRGMSENVAGFHLRIFIGASVVYRLSAAGDGPTRSMKRTCNADPLRCLIDRARGYSL
jgi:hypothetical protein